MTSVEVTFLKTAIRLNPSRHHLYFANSVTMTSSKLSQDRISEKVLEHQPEHSEHQDPEPLGTRDEIEEEPVVTFKTWIVVTVSAYVSKLGETISHVRFYRSVMACRFGQFRSWQTLAPTLPQNLVNRTSISGSFQ